VHLESIRLGVQRLEEGRDKARKLEQGYARKVIDGAEQTHLVGIGDS